MEIKFKERKQRKKEEKTNHCCGQYVAWIFPLQTFNRQVQVKVKNGLENGVENCFLNNLVTYHFRLCLGRHTSRLASLFTVFFRSFLYSCFVFLQRIVKDPSVSERNPSLPVELSLCQLEKEGVISHVHSQRSLEKRWV